MSDPRFVEAVRNVKHDENCVLLTLEHPEYEWGFRLDCDCTRDARIAAGIEAAYGATEDGATFGLEAAGDFLSAFTSASAPKEEG